MSRISVLDNDLLVPADDIPKMLRKMAEDIESGEYGDCLGAVFILSHDDSFTTFGWGEDCQGRRDIVYYLGMANSAMF